MAAPSERPPALRRPYSSPTLRRISPDEARASGSCPMCGWRGADRNGEGRCVDYAACAHRTVLETKGRPRALSCDCTVWPCPCACHTIHAPALGVFP